MIHVPTSVSLLVGETLGHCLGSGGYHSSFVRTSFFCDCSKAVSLNVKEPQIPDVRWENIIFDNWKVKLCFVLCDRQTPAAAAKSLQLCPTLCNPIDGSPPGSPDPGILQARTLEWVAISFSNAGK